jgi:hypothetical protein
VIIRRYPSKHHFRRGWRLGEEKPYVKGLLGHLPMQRCYLPTARGDMNNQVVARFRDGRLVKGISLDVDPTNPLFHVRPPGQPAVEVKLADLKALYFVKSLDGNPAHEEGISIEAGDRRTKGSTIVEIRFEDGERLVGFTNRYPPNRPHYFVVPVDLKSNNVRILVNTKAVVSIQSVGGEQAVEG